MKKKKQQPRLVIVGGPSCVGKSPLAKALKRLRPELAERLQPLVLHNSRAPRPGEEDGVDYHFRSRGEIEKLRGEEDFIVKDVRGDLQAVDLSELRALMKRGDAFFEGNPYIARALLTHDGLEDVERLGIFVSPLSAEELRALKEQGPETLRRVVADLMRRKQLRRAQKQNGILGLPALEDAERRANVALRELKEGRRYHRVIVNHDGEDSDNWTGFGLPLGDARRAAQAFAALLAGEPEPAWVETWDDELLADVEAE